VIRSFTDRATEDIFNGVASKVARKRCPSNLWKIAVRKLDQLDSVVQLPELRIPPGNHFESLHRDREGQYSISFNDQYRICFSWTELGPIDVEVTDYH
jgi:toxin HigB-1